MLATCSRYGETFEFDYHYIISILLCLHKKNFQQVSAVADKSVLCSAHRVVHKGARSL